MIYPFPLALLCPPPFVIGGWLGLIWDLISSFGQVRWSFLFCFLFFWLLLAICGHYRLFLSIYSYFWLLLTKKAKRPPALTEWTKQASDWSKSASNGKGGRRGSSLDPGWLLDPVLIFILGWYCFDASRELSSNKKLWREGKDLQDWGRKRSVSVTENDNR